VTATYTATAADVGKTITNIATVTGTTADNRTVTDTDDAKVDVVEVKGESKTLPATGAPALPLLLLGLTSLLGGAVVTRRTR
jgi:LPXTG-motif cell wall-anchored protein